MKGHWAPTAVVWALTAIAGAAVAVAAARPDRPGLFALALAASVVVTFCVQLLSAVREGFVLRLMVTTLGALALLAVASLVSLVLP
ncbi:hypothetical protein [Naasia aerilata]|uniref:Uncharacterized protein n=1 Tax=Naasia aerilata TaxID=1162966 RepID=A0ABM8G9I6_9MICO|nr:hypothetical protein [Naasia aerilata]BDZ44868.1 hypothetical protein GCM10025866_07770 [Naasia aerilata]